MSPSKNKIIFIGTGSAQTSLARFYSSLLLRVNDYNLLVDCGDGISHALLSRKISFNDIDGVLFSHFHPDHASGFPMLLVQMKTHGRQKPLKIFLHKTLVKTFRGNLLRSYLFEKKIEFDFQISGFGNNLPVDIGKSFSVIARENSHLKNYKQFDPENKLSLTSSSFLLNVEGSKIFYSADLGDRGDLYIFKDQPIDIFISEISHIGLTEIHEAFRSSSAEKLFLTHIGQQNEQKLEDFLASLKEEERAKITVAYDGLEFDLIR